jgi:ketopantoate reductase
MQMLIVGIGALGGTIAARAIRAGLPVRLAARSTDSAEALRRSRLRVSGIGGEVRADAIDVAAIEDYGKGDQFDLILLATKAQDPTLTACFISDTAYHFSCNHRLFKGMLSGGQGIAERNST